MNRYTFFHYAVGFLLITLIAVTGLQGGTTGKISGKVMDQKTSEPLIGANVVIEGTSLGAATDLEGEFYIINIPPGIYTLRVMMMGYTTQRVQTVRVNTDLTTKLNFKLQSTVIEVNEAVTITAERSRVQKDLTSSARSFGADQIDQLPSRSVTDLVSLQAGVVRDAGGNLHIRGGRTSEISYLVDGVQIVNPINRSAGISIDDQAIQELKAITGTFNAEYGQALSGVVNIVTKEGSDQFNLNLTGYLGDHFSLDDDTYFVMHNTEWANEAVRALNTKSKRLFFDFSKYGVDWRNIGEEQLIRKPWLTRKNYLKSYNLLAHNDIQLNVSGPLPFTNHRLSYFISARYNSSPGYIYGKRYFMPWGFQAPISDTVHTFEKADHEIVPLNWYQGLSMQSKLNWKVTNNIKLSYGLYYNHDYSYGANNKYVPDGGRYYFTDRYTHILTTTFIFSRSTFLDFKGNYYQSKHKNYLYADPYDYRYMPTNTGDFQVYVFRPLISDDISVSNQANDFAYWGNDVGRSRQVSKYASFNADLTSQLTKRHLLKTGISGRFHELSNEYYDLQFSQVDYRPIVPSIISPFHTYYQAKPKEFAAYLQDKIEFSELIINIGLRFDYFDSDGRILTDPKDPQIYSPFKFEHIYKNYSASLPDTEWVEYSIAEREQFWYKKPGANYQLSPRLGISFPITEKGVLHFSYGHFFQNPEFQYLYTNPNFWITGAGAQNLVGNAELKAERTVMYEVGLQQEFSDKIYLHVTGFYRDIRNWVGAGIPIDTYRALTYLKYENKDHAAAKGITITSAYTTRRFSVNLDYTYLIAQGTSSDPNDAYNDYLNKSAPRVQLINLNWDQRQSLHLVMNYNQQNWTATLIGTMNSGFPYTPSFIRGESTGGSVRIGLRENSERMPLVYNLDLRLARTFDWGRWKFQVFTDVTNLLDLQGAQSVYSDTGQPDFTVQSYMHRTRLLELSSIDEYYSRPGMFTAPRYIQLGLRVSY